MDIERTMQFILDNRASVTARQEAAEIRAAATERRLDRRMDGIVKLIKTGMRMIVEIQEGHKALVAQVTEIAAAQKRTEERLAELAAAQKRTEQRFDRLLESMNKGTNGNKRRRTP